MGHTHEFIHSYSLTRRKFLKRSSATALALTSGFSHYAHSKSDLSPERTLEFINLHTGETLQSCYWANGKYDSRALNDINYVLRDHRADEQYTMDSSLLDLLYVLHQTTSSNSPYHVISAYRSPKTNEKLRKQGSGVAKRSLHMQGKAIDIRLPDISLKHLRDAAISLDAGGVGYYAQSNFIHIDIGRPRSW